MKKYILLACLIFLMGTEVVNAGRFTFVPSLSVYEIYDDNIFFLQEERIDDFITTVSPSFVSSYETKNAKISATYMSGLEFYSKYTELNNTRNQNASLILNLRPTRRLALDVTDSMAYYAAEYNRGYEAGGGGLGYFGYYGEYRRIGYLELPRAERIRTYIEMMSYPADYWSNSVDATLSYKLSRTIETYVGYFNRFYKYYEKEKRPYPEALENSWEQGGRTGINYKYSLKDTFNLGYEYQRLSYTRATDTEVHTASMGWTHKVSPTLSWTISGGAMFISYEEENERSWHASVAINKSFKRTNVALGYTRHVTAYGGMGGTGIYQTWWGNITSKITSHFTAGLTGSYTRQKPTTPGEERSYYEKMHYYTGGINLSYLLTRRLSTVSSYFYTHEHLEVKKENLTYHQAMLGLSYSFTPWLSGYFQYTYSNYIYPLFSTETREYNIYDNRIMVGLSFTWLKSF